MTVAQVLLVDKDGATYFGLEVQVSMKGPRTQKRPKVTLSKNEKLIGIRPLFLGKDPFHERSTNENIFTLNLALSWGCSCTPYTPCGAVLACR